MFFEKIFLILLLTESSKLSKNNEIYTNEYGLNNNSAQHKVNSTINSKKLNLQAIVQKAIKTEYTKLQNEIKTLKENQKYIEHLLNELISYIKQETSNEMNEIRKLLENSKKILPNQLNENIHNYDKHFNCLQNCAPKENLSTSCAEAMTNNDDKFGIYLFSIPNSKLPPFYAYCRLYEEQRWTIIQRRIDGSENFYRNWHDYKNGFGDLYGEFWLGLERLHALTDNRIHELWISLTDYHNNQKTLYYTKFSVASEADGYRLSVSGYIGDIEDSLIHNNGRKFSTYDNYDHENIYNNMNCAQTYKGAWWYYDCFACSLNGEFFSHSNRKTRYGIFWRDWHGYESLRSAHMAIRPL